ncbi:MAG: chorismate synthase [Calditrichales bacterium]|nr:MAG: chorismate synthase [Calditrichales bacterium]
MPGSTLGQLFKITTAGESHGPANIVIIDGLPAGIPMTLDDIQPDLDRRRPGQSAITTPRQESDTAEFLSGIFENKTTGTPLTIMIRNEDQRSKDYSDIREKYRPGHADFTYDQKYGFRDYRGGGRASARETVVRVAAGAVAKKMLTYFEPALSIVGYTRQVGDIIASIPDPGDVTLKQVEKNEVRCPDVAAAKKMISLIDDVRREGDSIGGVAEIVAVNVPAGLGDPVFDKLRADLGKAMFSLPAVMGVEFGLGFKAAVSRGSESNDTFKKKEGRIITKTNNHGGILGGISSGMPIIIRCAVKPTSSIRKEQVTVSSSGERSTLVVKGRHDPCLLPRFIPIAEAMVALTLADHYLRMRATR